MRGFSLLHFDKIQYKYDDKNKKPTCIFLQNYCLLCQEKGNT